MEIKRINISQINPAAYNPRKDLKPGEPEYEKLKTSLESFGYVDPIIWNSRTGNLVGGHQRLKVLVAQGLTEVEASVVDLSLEREKALNLALNKVQGEWDEDKLAVLLVELQQLPDFDVGLIGFDLPEISEILDRQEEAKEDGFDLDNELEKTGEPITKPGDLIELGPHRLLCGDSSKPEDIAKLLGGKKVSLIFTDPPYNVDYYGGNRPIPEKSRPKPSRNWQKIYNDNLTQEEYGAWLKKVFNNAACYLAPGTPIYVWNGHRQFGPMYQMFTEMGFHVSCVITWAKESFAIGYGDYNQQTEFCLYCWKEDNGAHYWCGPANESTLWQVKREPTGSYEHPTTKPVALAHRAIKNSSKRGDIVLDMFLGSGTTLIAAEGLERICYGVELSAAYCDVIIRRYLALVGKDKVSNELQNRYLKEVNNG
ncbi:MAG: DNA modification methylase [Candidatus Omnitrophica bacterium]|nr:DNA modification methylase [Candidatus Omnitrophota bacterium]